MKETKRKGNRYDFMIFAAAVEDFEDAGDAPGFVEFTRNSNLAKSLRLGMKAIADAVNRPAQPKCGRLHCRITAKRFPTERMQSIS